MKTKLIALVALAMADHAFLPADVAASAEFEVEATDAEGLLTAGKAKLAESPLESATTSTPPIAEPKTNSAKTVKARVLAQCEHGQPDDVVELPAAVAKAAEKDGLVDSNKEAVAYAAGLPQNQPKKQG